MCDQAVVPVRNLTWQQVILMLGLGVCMTVTVIFLAVKDKDVASILSAVSAFILAVVVGLGWSAKSQIEAKVDSVSNKTDQVKDVANGRTTELMEMVKNLQNEIAELHKSNVALALTQPPPTQDQP